MFFSNNTTERVNQRTRSYIGQVATISRDVSYGRGRAVMEDRTIWCVLCDYDIMANAKVIVVDVADKMSLKVRPFYN